MDLSNTPLSQPIKPYIECDGGYYALCRRCHNEIDPHSSICPYCHQVQDWSWFYEENN